MEGRTTAVTVWARPRLAWCLLGLCLATGLALGRLGLGLPATVPTTAAGLPADLPAPAGVVPAAVPFAPAQAPISAVPFAALPVVNFQGNDDVCLAWISVSNAGREPGRAIMVAWGQSTTCVGDCQGPVGVTCTGLIKPGAAWQLLGAQVPTRTASAMVFSFGDRSLAAIAPGLGFDDRAADYLCWHLHDRLAGCAAFAQFKAAAEAGGIYAGIPLDQAAGPPLAVSVLRHCPGGRTPGVETSSTYEAPASANAFQRDAQGLYRSFAAPLGRAAAPGPSPGAGGASILYVQNAGSRCAMVEVWLQAWGEECAAAELCRTVEIAPGAAVRLRLEDCVAAGWQGSAWLRSPDPVALVVEAIAEDMTWLYSGSPPGPAADISGAPGLTSSATEAFAPLVEDPAGGWTSTVVVQNLGRDAGRVRVTFLDSDGAVLERLDEDLCPQGSRAFTLAANAYGPAENFGSARVESLPLLGGQPAPVSAVLLASRQAAVGGAAREGYAYNLLPAALAFNAVEGGPGGLDQGVGVLALPAAPTSLDATGITTELAIQNLVTVAGETEVAVLLYDRNDLVASRCLSLAAREVAYLDLGRLGLVPNGFLGAAIVSASAWRHPEPGGANLVGLGGVLLHRRATWRGQDVPGDEAGVTTAIPLRQSPVGAGLGAAACPPPAPPPLPPPPAEPNTALAGLVFLPVLNYQGHDDVCQALVTVSNGSSGPGKAVLVLSGEPGFCPPECLGPVAVVCSGLIAPGADWRFEIGSLGAAEPLMSGRVYGFNDRSLADLGLPGGDDGLVADWLCAGGLAAGDCDRARRLHLAYTGGGVYEGLPLDQAFAAPFRARVERTCPDVAIPGLGVSSHYAGPSGAHFDALRPATGGFWQSAVPVSATDTGFETLIYLQNTGLSCTAISIAFQELGDCEERQVCNVFTLAPGETYAFDAADCVGPAWRGTAYIRGEAPLAIAVDHIAPSRLLTWAPEPLWSPYDLNTDGRVDEGDLGLLDAALGTAPGAPNWNPRADLDHNELVDAADRYLLLRGGLCRDVPPPATATPPITPTPEGQTPTPPSPTPDPATPSPGPGSPTATATQGPLPPEGWRLYLPAAFTPGR